MAQGFTNLISLPVPVVNGGTGNTSATAYAVQCGGTTSTANHQSIASVGTAGQVLVSNGAGALPSFQGITVLQRVSTETGAVSTGTTTIPFDDTVPQNTEGNQVMTLSITPTSSTSILVIDVVVVGCNSQTGAQANTAALFQDTTAGALAAVFQNSAQANAPTSIFLRHIMTSGTTSSTTFKVRWGGNAAGTATFNGQVSARIYGGVIPSSIMITEYSA